MMTWLKKLLAAIWAALTTPAPVPPVDSGGGSSPPAPTPDNQTPPPDAGTGAGVPQPPWGPDNPDPNDEDQGGYDSSSKWKPISDTQHNLVILTGWHLDYLTMTVGKETVYDGARGNGHRQHWRFSKPGKRYGSDFWITVVAKDGKQFKAHVKNGAKETALVWRRVR